MTTDKWTERLSEYLDGELTSTEGEALEAHLARCAECSATLEDLRGVKARASSLDDRPPTRDLWTGIADRIGATRSQPVRPIASAPSRRQRLLNRSITLRMPQLAAAAVALVVLSGGIVGGWIASGARSSSHAAVTPGTAVAVANVANLGGARYDSAVVELEEALAANQGQLDSTTVRVIRQNLAIIDQAIQQAQAALAADPSNVYLSDHLAGTLKRKVELLRRAASLTAIQS